MKQNLEKYCVQNGIFGDITFELDDGHLKAHRAMLVARCDVMKAMLNGDFREAHANLVRLVLLLHTFRRIFLLTVPSVGLFFHSNLRLYFQV